MTSATERLVRLRGGRSDCFDRCARRFAARMPTGGGRRSDCRARPSDIPLLANRAESSGVKQRSCGPHDLVPLLFRSHHL